MKRLLWALGAASVLLISVAGAAWVWLGSTLAPLGGRETVPALGDSVVVLWDSLAVPHLVASSAEDLFAALGYVHARDRMWQMDLVRHAAEGRLSELFGARTVATDRVLRERDIARIARARLPRVDPEVRRAGEAYARGVNAWLARGRYRALEFRLLKHHPEPWEPVHSLEIGVLQAWDLRSDGDELALASAVARLGQGKARELLPDYPDTAPVIVRGAGPRRVSRSRPVAAAPIVGGGGGEGGAAGYEQSSAASNSWVIGPEHTASGKPILANDPHLTLRAPSIWYLVGAHAPTYEVVGATFPGVPVVVVGHTTRVAWGLTNGSVDDMDFVVEQLDADSMRYRTLRGWAAVDVVAETIVVKGGEPVVYRRRRTAHGPLVATQWQPDSGRALAMRWVAQDAGSDEMAALLGLARATDWRSFTAALERFGSPEQNVVYADAAGNIGYRLAGHVPVRRRGEGWLPTRGWTEEGTWERYLASAELPHALNPPDGWIVTANHRIVGDEYPFFISRHWELPYRAQRILELLANDGAATAQSVGRRQLDVVDPFLRGVKGLAAQAALAAGREDLADRLRHWDGTMAPERPEPTLVWSWYRELERLTYEDESPSYRPAAPLHRWLAEGRSAWFDDIRTPEREDLPALARRALEAVLPQAEGVPWRAVHRTLQQHSLGDVPLVGRLLGFDIGPHPTGGGNYTVNVASSGQRTAPYQSTWGPSLRHVVDFGDVDGAGGFILPTGQSGHPLSRHYRDQTARWLKGELWIRPLDVPKVRAVDTLRLVPPHAPPPGALKAKPLRVSPEG